MIVTIFYIFLNYFWKWLRFFNIFCPYIWIRNRNILYVTKNNDGGENVRGGIECQTKEAKKNKLVSTFWSYINLSLNISRIFHNFLVLDSTIFINHICQHLSNKNQLRQYRVYNLRSSQLKLKTIPCRNSIVLPYLLIIYRNIKNYWRA